MGLGLSEKGERLLTADCEEAFVSITREKIIPLASQFSDVRMRDDPIGLVSRFMTCLEIGARYNLPDERINDSLPITSLQALLFYQDLEIRGNLAFYCDKSIGPRAFGLKCYAILEDYLIKEGLLDEDSWEEPI